MKTVQSAVSKDTHAPPAAAPRKPYRRSTLTKQSPLAALTATSDGRISEIPV